MSPPTPSLTSVALSAAGTAPVVKDTPESRNALIWSAEPLGAGSSHLRPLPPDTRTQLATPPVADDVLDYAEGGIDDAGKPRVSVLLGPGATIRGIAFAVAGVVNSATGGTVARTIEVDEIAAGLLVYNHEYLGLDLTTGQAGIEAFPSTWRVGLRVPLPLEISATQSLWTTNREALLEAADLLPELWRQLLTFEPEPLPIPDPDDLVQTVSGWLASAATPTQRAADLAKAFQINPYEPVFFAIEALRQLQPSSEVTLVRQTLASVDEYQADLIAATTAGNAAFRRFWATLSSPEGLADSAAGPARQLVGTALGLKTSSDPAGFKKPQDVGPLVVPEEIRLTASQAKGNVAAKIDLKPRPEEDPGGLHTMVLGRDLCVGNRDSYSYGKGKNRTTWGGPSYPGRLHPSEFEQSHRTAVGASSSSKFRECLDVALAIAPNEGFLDGCRAADAGMISTGIQQWSVHTNTEFPVLLHRFRKKAPDHFDLFFGMYGLQPELWGPSDSNPLSSYSGDRDPTKPLPAGETLESFIAKANPDIGKSTPFGENYPTYCTFFRVDPDKVPERMPAPAKFPANISVDQRAKFFGAFHPKDKGKTQTWLIEFAPEWSGRIRLAALCSIDYCVNQLQLGSYRVSRIRREIPTLTVDSIPHPISDVVSSEFAAAMVLDQHINKPRRVETDLKLAIARTRARSESPPHEDPPDDSKLRRDWLMRFAVNYLAIRDTAGPAHRNDRILNLHDEGLYPEPESFTGW